jgi:hypothetical protein
MWWMRSTAFVARFLAGALVVWAASTVAPGVVSASAAVTPPPGSVSVSIDGDHTCALTSTGGVECWGDNGYGELGDGTFVSRSTPAPVIGLGSPVTAVSAGGYSFFGIHTCALTAGGGVKCWGANYEGQRGDGSDRDLLQPTPVDVSGLTSGVQAIGTGAGDSCALTTAGGVKCWGDNEAGELGDGTNDNRLTPVDVSGLTSGVAELSVGALHACVVTTAGGVKCWGSNFFGELGDGTTTDRLTPVDVSGLTSGVAAVSAGFEATCALLTTGAVKCWGYNNSGQVGDGTTTARSTPVDVSGLSGVTALSSGLGRTCAVDGTGAADCWGAAPGDGTTSRPVPTVVPGLESGVAAISAGSDSCAFTSAGALKCWGDDQLTPVDVSGSFFRPECPTLVAPPHSGFVMSDGYAAGSTATFTSDPGYVLVGAATLTCQPDLTWSAAAPTTEPLCPQLTAFPRSSFSLSNGDIPGSVAMFTADAGYVLLGPAALTCQVSGAWSGSPPLAIPAGTVTTGVTVAGGNGPGSANNQLGGPSGVAVDAARNVYVADTLNNRVKRWAPGATSGVTVAGFHGGGSAADQLYRPMAVALDAAGDLYVLDSGNDRVQRWDPGARSGVTVAGGNGAGPAADQLFGPSGLALDSAGNVYIADTDNNRVQCWAPGATSGVTVAGGNGAGGAANQLDTPDAVAVDGAGNVFVADTWNHRVQRWAPGATSGVTVAGGHSYGSAANQFDYPTGLTLNAAGDLFVLDRVNSRVQWWAPGATSGVTLAGGGLGFASNQFFNAYGVALDGFGNIYVADQGNARIERWGNTAVPLTVTPGVGSVQEGNTGTTSLSVPVTLSFASSQTVTVQWNTMFWPGGDTNQADPTTDYTPASGTVTFAPGQTSASVSIPVNGDTLVEPDEYVIVSFHDPTNGIMAGYYGLGFGIITNDDHATVLPGNGFAAAPVSGTADLAVPVTLTNPSTVPVTVEWTTMFVSGAPDSPYGPQAPVSDYTPSSGTVTFAPGETSGFVHIPVLADSLSPGEYIIVSFHDPTNATVGGFWGLGFGVITPAS